MLTTAELLTDFLMTLFERKTVNNAAFEKDGDVSCCIPPSYFSSDRLKKKSETPINTRAVNRALEMARAALVGPSHYDAPTISARIQEFLLSEFGVDTSDFVLVGESEFDHDLKVDAQLAFLRCVLTLGVDVKEVDKEEAAAAIREEAARQREAAGWRDPDGDGLGGYAYGVEDFYFRVEDAGYPGMIGSVRESLDILHFHGLTWTNSNREFLGHLLAQPGVDVRVVLLDPASEFFGGFARYIGTTLERLEGKLEEAEEIWRTLAAEASFDPEEPSRLRVYRGDFYPAKSIYRFDRDIVVTPRTVAKPKGRFMAYRCTDRGPESAFRAHLAELEDVLGRAVLVFDSAGGLR